MTSETDAWRKDRNAPAPGTVLGPLSALPEDEAREFRFGEGRRSFSMLVMRRGGTVRAYVNVCPHVYFICRLPTAAPAC